MLFEPYCRRHGIVVAGGLSKSRGRLLCADSRSGRNRHDLFFLCPAVLLFRGINNSQHRLGAGINMHMLHSDRLLIVTPMLVERLDQLKLKPKQSSSTAAINTDVWFLQVTLTGL